MSGPINVSDNCVSVVSLVGEVLVLSVDEMNGLEFSISDGGELVDTHLVGLGGICVVLFDNFQVLQVDQSPEGFFLNCPLEAELLFVLEEVVLLLGVGVKEGG